MYLYMGILVNEIKKIKLKNINFLSLQMVLKIPNSFRVIAILNLRNIKKNHLIFILKLGMCRHWHCLRSVHWM